MPLVTIQLSTRSILDEIIAYMCHKTRSLSFSFDTQDESSSNVVLPISPKTPANAVGNSIGNSEVNGGRARVLGPLDSAVGLCDKSKIGTLIATVDCGASSTASRSPTGTKPDGADLETHGGALGSGDDSHAIGDCSGDSKELGPSAKHPVLVLVDMNGTLLYRAKRPLQVEATDGEKSGGVYAPAFVHGDPLPLQYYMRPGARDFVAAMATHPRVRLAFYTSMRGSNALPAARFLMPDTDGGDADGSCR